MKYTVTNIDYDTDGEEVDLPKELVIDIPNEDFVKYTAEEIDEFISDEISNITGFCHNGFSMSTLKKRLKFYYGEQEADYDPEETKNVLETLSKLKDDVSDGDKWGYVELLRMINSDIDEELYEEVNKLAENLEEKQRKEDDEMWD